MAETVFGINNFPIFVAMKGICHILFGFAAILFLPCVVVVVATPSSAGCINLRKNAGNFFSLLKTSTSNKIKLRVNY